MKKKKQKETRTPLFWIGIILLICGVLYLVLNPSVLDNISGAAMARDGENLKLSGSERYNIVMFANNSVGTKYTTSNKVNSEGYLTRFGKDSYDAPGLVWRAYYEKAGISFGPKNVVSSLSTVKGLYKSTPKKFKTKSKLKDGDLIFIIWKKKPVLVGIYDQGYVIYANKLKKKVVKDNLNNYLKTQNKTYLKNGTIIYGTFPSE